MKKQTILAVAASLAFAAQQAQAREASGEDTFKFGLSVYAEHIDNRDAVSGDDPEFPKEDSLKFGIGPTIGIFWRSGATEWRFSYSPIYQWWDDPAVGQVKSELTHAASASMGYLSGERLEFKLSDTLTYSDDPDVYLGDSEDLPEATDRRLRTSNSHFENRLSGLVNYRLLQRVTSTADAYWRIRRYDEQEVAETGDEDGYGASLGLSYQQTPFLSYGVQASYTAFDRETVETLESGEKTPMGVETFTVGLTGRYRINSYTEASGGYGYQFVQHENGEIEDREYPTDAKLELSVSPSARAQLLLGTRWVVTEGYVYPYVSQDLQAYYASLTLHHGPRISTTYRAEYRVLEYREKFADPDSESRDGEREELFLRFGLNYRWNDHLTVSAYYSHEDVDSEVSESYSTNTLGVRASYQF